jgi:RNA ligase (TIGR02306 family)
MYICYMRKLASIRKVKEIFPIEGADRIEVAVVDGWKVVVNKGLHKVGDDIIYFEIDSFLPIREEFEFLRKSSYRKMVDGTEGFRLRTIRLRQQVSQGLIIPISILDGEYEMYEDVTERLNVLKYEPPVPAQLSGTIKGNFPSSIKKTDEERIQNCSEFFENIKLLYYFITEKLDGTSFTNYFSDGNFGVCSRNLDLKRDEKQTHWKVAIENNLEEKLTKLGRNLAIQGEIIGEGIQKNRYKIKGHKLYVFNIFDIDNYEYLTKKEKVELCNELGLDMVPVISESMKIPNTIDEILKMAEGPSLLNKDVEREGFVAVSNDLKNRVSFKAISNIFLLEGGR